MTTAAWESGAPVALASAAWRPVLERVAEAIESGGAHPARCVVLLPYAQLMPLAAALWAERVPDGFMPHFETTRNWAARVGDANPEPSDFSFDHGRDLLVASDLLRRAGLAAEADWLAAALVAQAAEFARLAAAVPPAERREWMDATPRALAVEAQPALKFETTLTRIAVAWTGSSAYATDRLFTPAAVAAVEQLFVVRGLEPDPLAAALARHYAGRATVIDVGCEPAAREVALHACADAPDEAERAAACVLAHLASGRVPVALVATDRALTRRIGALLATRGVDAAGELRDETGWKLSTTHAAALLLAALDAAAPDASSDDVLNWVKLAPTFAGLDIPALEHRLRRDVVRRWSHAVRVAGDTELTNRVERLRAPFATPRSLAECLVDTKALLERCGLWPLLAADSAGAALIQALGLDAQALADWQAWPLASRRMDSAAFVRWVRATLEAATFQPPRPASPEVVILPLNQLFARPFAAVVLPGADETRLPALPEVQGPWSGRQRRAIGLPTREDARAVQQGAWRWVFASTAVDLLWSQSSERGEALQPSPLLQLLQLDQPELVAAGRDPRVVRELPATPTARPAARGDRLPLGPLSATGYERLRACPYRFFALQQLGLSEEGELDVDLQKRDWGNWLHQTLRLFHESLQADPGGDRTALIEAAAERATRDLGLGQEPGEFLPFQAAWADLRGRYLVWQATWEHDGIAFTAAEETLHSRLGDTELKGRIDRIDRDPAGADVLIDYKTERLDTTRKRLAAGTEETQLPFYAVLAGSDDVRALYLNLYERDDEGPRACELAHLAECAALLRQGMADDLARIAEGAPLYALGEGSVCDRCEVRGLCRKDFWPDTVAPEQAAA